MYDSTEATMDHIRAVRFLLEEIKEDLSQRQWDHDQSKLQEPEKPIFDRVTPLLRDLTYGSDEYFAQLAEMKPALDHHYAVNRHHPEYYPDGIVNMTLVDLIEMICDWVAAASRHENGDVYRSIEINQKRFGYSDELKAILINTVEYFSLPELLEG